MNWFNNASSRPTNNIAPPAISEYMKHIYQAVYNHVSMKTSGALLVTGNWGSGKTYYFKNFLFPNLEKDIIGTQSIIVSLYGVTDKDSIANKVLFAYLDNRAGNGKVISAASLTKGLQNLIDAVPLLKKHVDLNKLFKASGEDLFRFLPKEKLLICFDDLERMSEKIKPEDFMGLVNELVENKAYKVIIIANEKEIKDGIKFKEKTIEKTIHFKNDLSTIFDSITQNYDGTDFAQYLKLNKEFILKSLDPSHSIKDKQDKLSTSFDNIRTIKFAIEHFRPAFEIINEKFTINNELPTQQLKDIWLFVLAISIEFKEFNTISFKERKHLDDPGRPLSNDDLGKLIFGNEEENVQEENDWSFKGVFIKDYFERINGKYIYFPQIFNLITAGVTIEKASFLNELEASYNVRDGIVKPAYAHLSKFMRDGYWNFTDAEFVPALTQLLEYAEGGQYDDLLSYINAGLYLLLFSNSLNLTNDQIIEKLKAGINITIPNVSPTPASEFQFSMVTSSIEMEELKALRDYILEKLEEKGQADSVAERHRLEELFHNDLSAFVKDIYPKDLHIRSPEPLLFDSFNSEGFAGFIENWTPAAMMELVSLLDVRYNESAFAERLTGEIPFLQKLVEFLEKNPLVEEKVLSNNIRTGHLVPALKKAINRLEHHIPKPVANQNDVIAIQEE